MRGGLGEERRRDPQAKERSNEVSEWLDVCEGREPVGLEHGHANAPRRPAQVRQRQRHRAGHGELEATNCRRGERLGEGVGGLVSSGDVERTADRRLC